MECLAGPPSKAMEFIISKWRRHPKMPMKEKGEWDFIPRNAVKMCNKCKKRTKMTCTEYPKSIPTEKLLNGCPEFEAMEEK